jgi:hypothetical protein
MLAATAPLQPLFLVADRRRLASGSVCKMG